MINKSLEMEWLDDSIPAARVCNSITAYVSPHASLAMPLGSIVIAPLTLSAQCHVASSPKACTLLLYLQYQSNKKKMEYRWEYG